MYQFKSGRDTCIDQAEASVYLTPLVGSSAGRAAAAAAARPPSASLPFAEETRFLLHCFLIFLTSFYSSLIGASFVSSFPSGDVPVKLSLLLSVPGMGCSLVEVSKIIYTDSF